MTDVWDSARAAYDTVAAAYAEMLPGPTVESALDLAVVEEFVRRVGDRGPILDAGCGSGRMTRHLHDLGLQVSGWDLSPEMVRTARERHPDLSFSVGSIDALPIATGTAAGVFAWYSLIHTPDELLPAVLGELLRVLAPAGWLLVGGQSGTGTRHIARAYGHELDLVAHLHAAERLAGELERRGATVHVQLTRAPEGTERHPQAFVLARTGH